MYYRRKGRGYLNTQAHTSTHTCDVKRSISQSSTHQKNGSRQRMDSSLQLQKELALPASGFYLRDTEFCLLDTNTVKEQFCFQLPELWRLVTNTEYFLTALAELLDESDLWEERSILAHGLNEHRLSWQGRYGRRIDSIHSNRNLKLMLFAS